jgi:putative ABC transport system ATP-binding protein
MDELVQLEQVSRRYPMDHSFVTALEDVSLGIERGEFLAVAEPSGSGKSTLLNLIGCIDQPTSGRIFIDGTDTNRLSGAELATLRRRKIGFVFQTFNLIPVFTAFENVEYPLLLQRMPERERRRRVAEALESVGLESRAGHRPACSRAGSARESP